MLPLYYKAIAASAIVEPDARALESLAAAIRRIPDLRGLVRRCVQEETAGLLYACLAKAGLLPLLGAEESADLRGWYVQTARENLHHIRSLNHILTAFDEANIPAAVLKGMPLIYRIYKDVGLRKMADIDLWVPESRMFAATACLERLGFERDPVYAMKYRTAGAIIDLHTHFIGADRIRSRKYLLDEAPESIFENARNMDFDGSPVRCLPEDDEVLFLWLHAAKHNVGKLIWLVDIANIVRAWDLTRWRALCARAEELNQSVSVVRLLYFLDGLLGFRAPAGAWPAFAAPRPSPVAGYLLRRRVNSGALPAWAPMVLFSPGKGLLKHLRYGIETLFPRPDVLRQIFTGYRLRMQWPLYVLRCLQLAGAALTKLVQAVACKYTVAAALLPGGGRRKKGGRR